MKFALSNNYNLSLGASADKNTRGRNILNILFRKNEEEKGNQNESNLDSLHHDDAAAGIFKLNGTVEISAEISTEEFTEIAKFNRENSLLNKEELSWFYNGCRKAIANLAEDIKSYGKDIFNACWDVSETFAERNHQNDMMRMERNAELGIKRTETDLKMKEGKEKIRKQYEKESKKD